MVSGPEIARVISEFESSILAQTSRNKNDNLKHHGETPSIQSAFRKDVKALVTTMEERGNPFLEESEDLVVLDSKEILPQDAVTRFRKAEATGKKQYNTFVDERLKQQKKSIFDPIERNKLTVFSCPVSKGTSADKQKLISVKSDCSLFSRLYISCQNREGNIDEFFEHENHGYPPSISKSGELLLPQKKSELTECLLTLASSQKQIPDVDVVIIDGAVAVNMLKPKSIEKTFAHYAKNSFIPYVQSQLQKAKQVDIVWDEYHKNSLKACTRNNQGNGARRRVQGNNQLPRNWQQFLRVDGNKKELFMFLGESLTALEVPPNKQVITTIKQSILSHPPQTINCNLSPCSQEEADTRIFLHAADALKNHHNILVCTVDTDVLALAVSFSHTYCQNQAQIWVAYGTGANFKYIPAHQISQSLGPRMTTALPGFHAFTGCDTVSCFAGRGKKTAFTTWRSYPDVTEAFMELSSSSPVINDRCMAILERYVVLLYDRTSSSVNVNEARKQLFAQKGRSFEAIPPSREALLQHAKRAAYQGGCCWGQALQPCPVIPSPSEWGWALRNGIWKPFWTVLPDMASSSRQLIRCRCKKGCRSSCSCIKAELKCSPLCGCTDACDNY